MNYKDLWTSHSHRINADDSEKYMDEEDFKIAILEWESAKTVSRVELPVILPSELLPCPFCGGDADFILDESVDGIGIYVKCLNNDCGIRGKYFSEWDWQNNSGTFSRGKSEFNAKEFWNKRASQ